MLYVYFNIFSEKSRYFILAQGIAPTATIPMNLNWKWNLNNSIVFGVSPKTRPRLPNSLQINPVSESTFQKALVFPSYWW